MIKWNPIEGELCHKIPDQEICTGTQIIVDDTQTAFLVKDGQVCDEFKSGTYSITPDNIPQLQNHFGVTVDSQYTVDVWFICKTMLLNIKWGTPNPIEVDDAKYGIAVPIRAYGTCDLQLVDGRSFLEAVLGFMPSSDPQEISRYLKNELISRLDSALPKQIVQGEIPILEANGHLEEIAQCCMNELNSFYLIYGVSISDFSIISLNLPSGDASVKELKQKDADTKREQEMLEEQKRQDELKRLEEQKRQEERARQMEAEANNPQPIGAQASVTPQGTPMSSTPPSLTPPPLPPDITYYVNLNGQQLAGQTIASIQVLIAQGIVNFGTLVWRPGMQGWLPISSVPEIMSVIAPGGNQYYSR